MKTITVVLVLIVLVVAGCGGNDEGTGLASSGAQVNGDLALTSTARAQGGAAGAEGITVTGTGSANAVPDIAEWSFGVQADADSASAALESASASIRRVLGALRDAGIADKDLKTEQVSVYPRTSEDGLTVVGYSASTSVRAVIRELGAAGQVLDATVAAGANQVYGPTLRLSDARAQYQAAVDAALDDARARAEAIAAKAGVELGAPVAIVESGGGGDVAYAEGAAVRDASVPIEPGQEEVTATLSVTYAIA
jgi:uncharacterized protein YggE